MSDIALILAKKGSKGLPGKNLLIWKKKTLLEHTIEHLKKTKLFDKIYISTNCKIIGNIGKILDAKQYTEMISWQKIQHMSNL